MQRLMFYLILMVGNEVVADPRYVFREICEVDLIFILLYGADELSYLLNEIICLFCFSAFQSRLFVAYL